MSDYIMDLRSLVGHRPLLQVGASVIVEDEQGRILLQLRSDNNCWGYAGGSVELDEAVEEAAKRELLEETGLTANKLELFGIFSGSGMHYIYPNGDEVSNIDIVYLCRDYSGELKCGEKEVSELRFFDVENIPDNISSPAVRPIKQWIAGKRQPGRGLLKADIKKAELSDREFWYTLDRHLPEAEFENKVRDGRGYVLRLGGKPAAILRYSLFWDSIPFCNMLFVEEGFRRQGCGKMLMEHWERDMKEQGLKMVLTSTQADEEAQHFYRKLGYRDCGGLVIDVTGYEQPMELFMIKQI